MKRRPVAAIAVALFMVAMTACDDGGGASQRSSATAHPSQSLAAPSPSVDPVALVCEAFDIVNNDISSAYDAISKDLSTMALNGLAIMSAGSNIAALAHDSPDSDIADRLKALGQAYIDEGMAINKGDMPTGLEASDMYFALLDDYGQDC